MRVERSNVMKVQQIEDGIVATTNQEEWLETVRRQVGSLRFGVVQVVVHDSRVVQIEKTEKFRIEPAATMR
jgi:hypothetical protein